jgi:hypothetical protein
MVSRSELVSYGLSALGSRYAGVNFARWSLHSQGRYTVDPNDVSLKTSRNVGVSDGRREVDVSTEYMHY